MTDPFPLAIDSPTWLAATLTLAAVACVVALVRRIGVSRVVATLGAAALVLLALAAAGATWRAPRSQRVAVVVDVSDSTRTAGFRDDTSLEKRIGQLLADLPHEILRIDVSRGLAVPPDVAAVVLFSDGRFDPPAGMPPTYVAIEPRLDDAADAAVERLEWRDGMVATTVRNAGGVRDATWGGTGGPGPTTVPARSTVVLTAQGDETSPVSVSLAAGDAWPENDSLTIAPPPSSEARRWWVGGSPPDASWTAMAPGGLPLDPAAYLSTSLLVLDNVPAGALDDLRRERLEQFVRDLGGGLLIVGGDRAFAAGGYPGTVLEVLSPLASAPPRPTTRWVLLADGSGSMAAAAGGARGSRWDVAARALVATLRHLPPADPVDAGSFAADVTWWTGGQSAREAATMPLPPGNVSPRGPTNLEAALRALAASSDGKLPTQAIVLTDAEAQLDDADALATQLRDKRITLNVIATGDVPADHPVRRIVASTGGRVLTESDPAEWARAAREMAQAATPDEVMREPVELGWLDDVAGLPPRTIETWNQTWPKDAATPLAEANGAGQRRVMAARWSVGGGTVAAVAFRPSADEVATLSAVLARAPRDPRVRVTWETGASLSVTVDAVDQGQAINGLAPVLEIRRADASSGAAATRTMPQVGPGRYEVTVPAPREPSIAMIRAGASVLDRRAIAGRYPAEFDAIGNDRVALRRLAERTGGAVIEPNQTSRIDFAWPRKELPLSPWLAALGAAAAGAALVAYRRGA